MGRGLQYPWQSLLLKFFMVPRLRKGTTFQLRIWFLCLLLFTSLLAASRRGGVRNTQAEGKCEVCRKLPQKALPEMSKEMRDKVLPGPRKWPVSQRCSFFPKIKVFIVSGSLIK